MINKYALSILIFFTSLLSFGQYFITAPGSSTPSGIIPPLELLTCEPGQNYNVTFDNFSPYTISNITINFQLPPGVVYDGGFNGFVTNGGASTGATVNLTGSPGSTITVTINNMSTQDKANLEFKLKAECGAFQHSKSGGSFTPNVQATFTPSNTGVPQTQNYTLPDLIVKYPDLSVTVTYYDNNGFVAPQYNPNDPEVGDSIFRIIRIENGGEPLTNFTYKAKHGNCLDVFGHDLGTTNTITSGGTIYEVVDFNGTDFTGIGNNDNVFDRGEVILLRETAVILCCNNPNTEHQVMWGCSSSDICQFETTNIGITFPPSAPRIAASSNMVIASPNDTLCYGDFNPIQMRLNLQNVGANPIDSALNVRINVHQGRVGFNANYLSVIDFNSLVVTKGGAPIPYTLVNTSPNNSAYCSGPGSANPVGRFIIDIDRMYAGENIQVRWNVYTCNSSSCNNNELGMLGWRYEVNYSNRCNNNYTTRGTGYNYKEIEHGLSPNGNNPGYTGGNQAQTFKFTVLESDFNIPKHSSDYLKYVITIPSCMNFTSSTANLNLRKWDGTILNPTTINVVGNTITATFQNSFYNIEQWELVLKLVSKDCSAPGCGVNAFEEVNVQTYYKATTSCGAEHYLGCAKARYKRNCQGCSDVLTVNDLSFNGMRRTSTGYKDLNDDGIADAGNVKADPATDPIRTDRASYGDTVSAFFDVSPSNGIAIIDPTGSFCGISPAQAPPNYMYFYTKIKNGSYFDYLSLDLTMSTFTCAYANQVQTYANYPSNLYSYAAGPDSTIYLVEVDIQAQIAASNWPSNLYKIEAKLNFRINDNPPNPTTPCPYEFAFYPSATQSSTFNPTHPNLCNIYFGNIDLIGYRFASYESEEVSFHSCQTVEISETYRFNMGEWFDGNVATNYYPKEYREYAFADSLIITTNNVYNLVSAQINYDRTAGILQQANVPYTNLMPFLQTNTGSRFVFSVGDLFRNSTFPYSDEGFKGKIRFELEPSCFSLGMKDTINYEWQFDNKPIIDNCPSTLPIATSSDKLEYNAPDIQLQASNTIVPVTTNTFTWDVLLSNNSNISNAANIWFALDNSTSSINILSVERIAGGPNFQPVGTSVPFGNINPTSDHYRLNNLGGGKEIKVRIRAEITGCSLDSIKMLVGYNCDGFPANMASVTCPVIEYMLYAEPKFPNISTTSTASQNPTDLCDEVTYTFKVQNTRLGRAYNVIGEMSLPIFLNYIAGSAEINDPNNPGWTPVTPTFTAGRLTFNISNLLPTTVGANGLKGVNYPTENYVEIRFRAKTECNFVSGSKIEFLGKANAACGLPFRSQPLFTDPIDINGALQTHETTVIVDADWLTPCNESTNVDVSIINLGPITSWTGDTITMVLPDGIIYDPGTYGPIANASAAAPVISNYAGKQYLKWSLNNLNITTDTAKFNLRIKAIPDSLETCQEKFLYVYTTNLDNVTCSSSGTPCDVNVITGDTLEPVFVEKGNLDIIAGSATSIPNPPSGETVLLSLTIDNIGPQIDQFVNGNPNPTIISFYEDVDASGTYTPADVLITYDTLLDSIPNGTYNYYDSINFPAGKACEFIVVIDFLENSCICTSTEYFISNVKLIANEPNDSVCASIVTPIGYENPIVGYDYTWSRILTSSPFGGTGTHLDNNNIPNPKITAPNPTGAYDSLIYQVEIDSRSCISYDTIVVYITQSPVADAGLDDTVCGDNYTLNGNQPLIIPGVVTTIGEWTIDPTFGNGALGATFADSSVYNTTVSGLVSGEYQFIWSLDNGYCIGEPDTVKITVFSTDYRIGNDTVLCNETTFALNAPALDPGFTGLWSFNAGSAVATLNNNTSNNGSLSGLTDGLYSLEWKVTSPNGFCTYRDTIVIDVYQSAIPLAGNDSVICGSTTFNLWANNLTGRNQGLWSVDSATSSFGNVNITNLSNAQSSVNFTATGEYDLIWASLNLCDTLYDTVHISLGLPPTANAGANVSLCEQDTLVLNANNLNTGETGEWTALGSNPTVVTFDDNTDPKTTVRNLATGTYKLIWEVKNNFCDSVTDTIEIIIDTMPIANAGTDTIVCETSILQLYAQAISANQVGQWKQLDSNPALTFMQPNSPSSYVSGLLVGNYILEWAVTNNICDTVKDTLLIEIKEAPIANAGNDTAMCLTNTTNLNAIITTTQTYHTYEWSFDAVSSSVSNVPTIVAPTSPSTAVNDLGVGVYYFVLKANNTYCDSTTDTVVISIHGSPIVDFTASLTEICADSCIEFVNLSNINDSTGSIISSYTWDFGDGNSSNSQDELNCYNDSGLYNVKLIVSTDNGCSDSITKSNYIQVNPNPIANFSFTPDYNINPGTLININDLSQGANAINYNMGDGFDTTANTFDYSYQDTGYFNIKQVVSNQFGCTDSIIKEIYVKDEVYIVIPNSFTPNDDKFNEEFIPVVLGVDPDSYRFQIFNRWGQLMFETVEQGAGWDGKHQDKPVPTGTYVWKLTFKKKDGIRTFERTGHVTLFK